MKRPAQLSLLVALLLVLGAWAAVALPSRLASPPVEPEAAGLSGGVWVMPERDVGAFLRTHGVVDPNAGPTRSGTAVVGRVSWAPHPGGDQDRFTILLGDERGGAGVIERVVGLPEGQVSLGSGSMWNETVKTHDWLRGNRPAKVAGGWTDYSIFASIPTTWSGDVWFIGHVVDVATSERSQVRVDSPLPVVGVALTTADRVWWLRRVTAA